MRIRSFRSVVALAIISLSLASCGGHLKFPELKGVENVKMGKLGLSESNMTLELRYHNPNNSKLKLINAEGDTWIDSSFLGHFVVDTLVRIPANSDFVIPIKLKMDMKFFLLTDWKGLVDKKDVWVKVIGKAKVGKSIFTTHRDINYQGKQDVQALLGKMPMLQQMNQQ